MSGDHVEDDEYVARLLRQDALNASKKYNLVGLDAFKSRSDAPKPNTGFLRHIIRQTDSHNAALQAKEAKESRARLRQLDSTKNRGERLISEGRTTSRSSEANIRAAQGDRGARDCVGMTKITTGEATGSQDMRT